MKKQSSSVLKYPVPKLSIGFKWQLKAQFAVVQYGQDFYRIKQDD